LTTVTFTLRDEWLGTAGLDGGDVVAQIPGRPVKLARDVQVGRVSAARAVSGGVEVDVTIHREDIMLGLMGEVRRAVSLG